MYDGMIYYDFLVQSFPMMHELGKWFEIAMVNGISYTRGKTFDRCDWSNSFPG
jgi:hypothetical protein